MKKACLIVLSLLLAMSCLAGCGQNAKDPVTLTMWHNYGGDMQQTMDLLIDQFNATVGKEQGVVINVTAISSSSDLNESLNMIANDDPGAPDMPDIFTGYPKIAMQFQEKGMLAELGQYFTEEELAAYIDAFVEEGRLGDGGLYVFPIAKSTEILYFNQTLFDEFSAATGADIAKAATVEGLAELARAYYEWSGGKQFFASDDWFNLFEVGAVQLGGSLFHEDGTLNMESAEFSRMFNTLYAPSVEGGFAIYDGYSSDLSKTGDLVCSSGSSAGILFYGDTITYSDGTVREVEYSILPYPVFEGGEKWALQRGGGLMVSASDKEKEKAAAEFIKWLTAPEQNMQFISRTGYLPVTRQAFEVDMTEHLEELEDERIKKMLTAVLDMYEDYQFFTAPNFPSLDEESSRYSREFKQNMARWRQELESGGGLTAEEALKQWIG